GVREPRWTEGAGRSLSRGWERALCREEAECPPWGEGSVTTVWRSVVEGPPSTAPSVFYSSITKKIGKQAVTSPEMCRAQLWDLDGTCSAGAIDGAQGQGWMGGDSPHP
ncbi:hypothetical protein KUCAC02_027236, partial [Chaenocephalus aceratus]